MIVSVFFILVFRVAFVRSRILHYLNYEIPISKKFLEKNSGYTIVLRVNYVKDLKHFVRFEVWSETATAIWQVSIDEIKQQVYWKWNYSETVRWAYTNLIFFDCDKLEKLNCPTIAQLLDDTMSLLWLVSKTLKTVNALNLFFIHN